MKSTNIYYGGIINIKVKKATGFCPLSKDLKFFQQRHKEFSFQSELYYRLFGWLLA